jgi:hypothetical protein
MTESIANILAILDALRLQHLSPVELIELSEILIARANAIERTALYGSQ